MISTQVRESKRREDFWVTDVMKDGVLTLYYVNEFGEEVNHYVDFSTKEDAQKAADLFMGQEPGEKKGFPQKDIRLFDTGATRDVVEGKLSYVKALSPIVLQRYVQYLSAHRKQPDGSMRDFDNWKNGIPIDAYLDGLGRHFVAAWLLEHGFPASDNHGPVTLEDSLCAIIFGASGWLHELLKEKPTEFVCPEGWRIHEHIPASNTETGWSVFQLYTGLHLHKNNTLHHGTNWEQGHKYGEAPGYWPTKEAAENALRQYLEKTK